MSPVWSRVVVAVPIGLIASLAAFALDPSKAVTQYVRRSWSVQHGLPQDSVQAISQTKDGYMWLGTQEGLVRFDGSRFDVYDSSNVGAFEANNVMCIYRDDRDTLWISTLGGVTTYRDGKFTAVAKREGLQVFAMAPDPASEAMYFGTVGDRLFRYSGGQLVEVKGTPKAIVALAWSHGVLWVGALDGLYRYSNGNTEKVKEIEGSIYSLYADGSSLWIGGADGLHHYDGRHVRKAIPEFDKGEVWAIKVDRHKALWFGTRDGLWRWANGKLSHFSSKEGLSHELVDSIYEDADGTLWVGTHLGGVTLLYDGLFVSHTQRDGLSDDTIWTVAEDSAGVVWAGTERGGLNRFQNGTWSRVSASTGLHDKLITSVAPSGTSDGLWVGTYQKGLYFLSGDSARAYYKKDGLPHDSITALLVDRKGTTWIGTEEGLASFDGRQFKTYTDADGLPGDRIIYLAEDAHGRVWAATSFGAGVAMFDGARFVSTVDGIKLPTHLTISLFPDRFGEMWFGTRNGVYRMHSGGIFRYTAAHGMPSGSISQITEDERGYFWIAISTGILRVARRDLDAVLERRANTVHTVLYGLSDGLPATELAQGVFPGAWKASDGRIWLATAKGAAVLDPRAVPPSLRSRPIVDNVRVNAVPLSPRKPVVMSPGQDRIEFRYSVPTFTMQNRLRFRYRLEGYDPNWIEAGDRRVAEYTNLPPGRYRFRVEAADGERSWVSAMSMVDVQRLPAMYQTKWFLALCIATAFSLMGFAHYRRIRALRLQHELIHSERRRIALEFHDTLAHGLTGAMLHIDSALEGVNDAPRVAEHLHTGRGLVRTTLADAQRVLFNLRSSTLESSDLAQAFQTMISRMTKDLAVRATVEVVGRPRRLRDPGLENHVLRIGQEAMTNALRHARAKNIVLKIEFQRKKVVLTVRDDGRGSGGFKLDEMAASSYGLRGMQERADQIRAKLGSRTTPGGGLEITVEVNA